jgi:hypothetical protein
LALDRPSFDKVYDDAGKIPYVANPLSNKSKSTRYSSLTVLIVLIYTLTASPNLVLLFYYSMTTLDLDLDLDFVSLTFSIE